MQGERCSGVGVRLPPAVGQPGEQEECDGACAGAVRHGALIAATI